MSNYFTFWHLTGPVFARPADTNDLFLSSNTIALTAALREFAETKQNLAVLTGQNGSGKTTILRWLAQALPIKTHDVLLTTLLGRELESGWLLQKIAAFFQSGSKDRTDWKSVISIGLEQLHEEDRRLLVCIDTAHLICNGNALSDLEAFFNLQDLSGVRVSFLLSGTSELIETLEKYPSISARVNSFFSTSNLTFEELISYTDHCFKKAGVSAIFEPEALQTVYNETEGNFLISNSVLEKCMIEAAAKSARRITTYIVENVLDSTLIKYQSTNSPVGNVTKVKEKPKRIPQMTDLKVTEQSKNIVAAKPQLESKIEHERSGSIKLSSLFKQDKD